MPRLGQNFEFVEVLHTWGPDRVVVHVVEPVAFRLRVVLVGLCFSPGFVALVGCGDSIRLVVVGIRNWWLVLWLRRVACSRPV